MKILILEDNAELTSNIRDFMEREGCICTACGTYAEAFDKLSSFDYDCIILDIMLPDNNGLNLVKYLKDEKIASGILIISAKNSLGDRVKGLEWGADDYLTKPFHLTELNARIKAIYRRKKMNGERIIIFQEISINHDMLEARVHGQVLDLTKKEFDLLVYFLINKNRVLTRQSIAEHLWGDYADNLANFDFVYQHVKNLRKKIEQERGKDYIRTVYGLGYKFDTTS